MTKQKWNPAGESDQALEAVIRGDDKRLQSHHARIIADRELTLRRSHRALGGAA